MLNHLSISENLGFLFFLDVALKATLFLVLIALVVALLSRSSAALRHRVWVLSLTALLVLPAVIALVPQWTWQVIPRQWQQTPAVVRNAPSPTNPDFSQPDTPLDNLLVPVAEAAAVVTHDVPTVQMIEPTLPVIENVPSRAESTHTEQHAGESAADQSTVAPFTDWLLLIWLSGTLLSLVPLTSGLLGNLRLRIRGRRLVDSEWQRLIATFSNRLSLRRQVTLLLSGPGQMPMTFGLWRPCVVLPDDAPQWSAQRRQLVLLHELAHVKRYDVPLQILARFASSLYWFHPLVWWAMRRLRLEREHACDDCVLQTGQEADRYATELLEMANGYRRSPVLLNAALSMARRSQLEGRLLAVLDAHRCRVPVNTVRTGVFTLLALILVIGLGVVRPTLEAETRASGSENDSTTSVASKDPTAETRNQMVLTGNVLSPQGKPVAGARVEVIAYNRSSYWRRDLPGEDGFDYYQTQTDDSGRFRLAIPRNISRPRRFMQAIASAAGGLLTGERIDPSLTRSHLELKLHASKEARLQLIDTAGNPVVNIEPHLKGLSMDGGGGFGLPRHESQKLVVSGWPRFSRSNKEGYVSIKIPSSTKQLSLFIDDNRIGSHDLKVDVSDEPVSVVLQPAQFLNGKVTDAENSKPIAGAEVVLIERPYRRVRTNADGSFRIARGTNISTLFPSKSIMQVYPPAKSDYLFQAFEWKWPNDGIGDAKLSIKLQRGIVMEGRVVEKGTGNPMPGTILYFEPQRKNNPFFNKSSVSRFSGSVMKYVTDAQGRFRMPVWPGPGYLLLKAPTLDYVHVQVSMGEKWYGKPGLQREYHDGALRLNLEPGENPQPLKIELQRGVTLRRKVVRPDGRPAVGKAFARSYLQNEDDISGVIPSIPINEGILEMPGFEPEHSNPLFILDVEHHCGASVSPTDAEVTLAGPPIQLQKCGAAKFHFVNDKGKALPDYTPRLLLIVTPGATNMHWIRPDQPLWADSLNWRIFVHPATVPKTDADGRVTVHDLIPGVTYRLSFFTNDNFDSGYEFTVRSGETTDVGKVVLQLQR